MQDSFVVIGDIVRGVLKTHEQKYRYKTSISIYDMKCQASFLICKSSSFRTAKHSIEIEMLNTSLHLTLTINSKPLSINKYVRTLTIDLSDPKSLCLIEQLLVKFCRKIK
jgi:hypothetical protein